MLLYCNITVVQLFYNVLSQFNWIQLKPVRWRHYTRLFHIISKYHNTVNTNKWVSLWKPFMVVRNEELTGKPI